jgi:hypothetical protein
VINGAPHSWQQALMIATLGAGPDSLASHRAAAALWRLDGIAIPPPIEISLPYGTRYSGVRVHQMSEIIPADIDKVSGIPTTSPVRTLIDSAWYVDPPMFERMVEGARRKGLVSLAKLSWRLNLLSTQGRPGATTVRDYLKMMAKVIGISKSDLETRFDQLARAAGLPPADRNVEVTLPNGRKAEIDRYWPQFELAVELDGSDVHKGTLALVGDNRRSNQLYLLKKPPIRFTYWDLVDIPDETIAILRAAMELKAA